MKLVVTTPHENQATNIRNAEAKAVAVSLLSRVDLRNLAMVLSAFVLVLVLVPPVRTFPINDDWAYSQSVSDLLHWAYKPHDWTQPTALGHLVWGALFSVMLGYNFTTITLATLMMSAVCLIIFYLLLRHLNVGPTGALLGTVLLGCNPLYVYLSYSFMTDVTFLAYVFAALLCYVKGGQTYGQRYSQYWFLLGGAATSLAYLTRQVGVFVALAALLYLWWSRKWTWQTIVAVAALPVVVVASYMLWESTQPTRFVAVYLDQVKAYAVSHPIEYALGKLQNIALSLTLPALCLSPLFMRPRKALLAVPLLAYLLIFQTLSFRENNTMFPAFGNVVADTGFAIGFATIQPLWRTEIWVALGIAGALLFSLYIVTCAEWVRDWFIEQKQRAWQVRSDNPDLILYAYAFILTVITFVISPVHYDRYMLPLLPALMLPALQRIEVGRSKSSHLWRWLLIAPIALFSIVGMRDYLAHVSARWQAAEQLVAQGAKYNQVYAGFEWMGQHLYKDGVEYIRRTGDTSHAEHPPFAVLDPLYVVSDLPRDGYVQVGQRTYQSWLEGGRTQQVLSLKRK